MRLRVSAPLSIMASVAIVLAAIAMIASERSAATVQWAKEKEMNGIAALVEAGLRQSARTAVAQAELIAGMPGVGPALARGDVAWLKGIIPAYQHQRAKFGIEGAAFVTPPATVALRLHDAARMGDDQSAKRPILVVSNRLHEPQSGVEISPTSAAMRGTAPINHNGVHVGIVEWSIGLFTIAQEIHDATNAEVTFFVEPKRVEGNRTAEERRLGPVAGLVSTDWEQASSLLRPLDLEEFNGVKITYHTLHSVDYGAVHVPLFDFSGQRVGTVVAVREVNEFSRAQRVLRAVLTTAVIVGTLAIGVVVVMVITGMMVLPIGRLSNRAGTMAKGDFSSPVSDIHRDDEIGGFARALEAMRQSLLRRFPPGSSGKGG